MQSQTTRRHNKDQKISHFVLLHLLVVACVIHLHAPSDANAAVTAAGEVPRIDDHETGESDTGSSPVDLPDLVAGEVLRIDPPDLPAEVPSPVIDLTQGEGSPELSNVGTPSSPPNDDSISGDGGANRLELFDPESVWSHSIANPLNLGLDFDSGRALNLAMLEMDELAMNPKNVAGEPEHEWLGVLDIEGGSPNAGIPNGRASETGSSTPRPALNHSNRKIA
jgi:hypothetical protein